MKRRRNDKTTDLTTKQRRNEEDGNFLELMSSLLSVRERERDREINSQRTMEFVIPQHLLNKTYSCESFVRFADWDRKTLFRCSMVADRLQFILRWSQETFLIPLVMRYCNGSHLLVPQYIHLSEDPLAQYLNYSRNLNLKRDDREQSYSVEEFLSQSPTLHAHFPSTFTCGARRQTALSLISQVLIYLPCHHHRWYVEMESLKITRRFLGGGRG